MYKKNSKSNAAVTVVNFLQGFFKKLFKNVIFGQLVSAIIINNWDLCPKNEDACVLFIQPLGLKKNEPIIVIDYGTIKVTHIFAQCFA